jgi:hypothetical protein
MLPAGADCKIKLVSELPLLLSTKDGTKSRNWLIVSSSASPSVVMTTSSHSAVSPVCKSVRRRRSTRRRITSTLSSRTQSGNPNASISAFFKSSRSISTSKSREESISISTLVSITVTLPEHTSTPATHSTHCPASSFLVPDKHVQFSMCVDAGIDMEFGGQVCGPKPFPVQKLRTGHCRHARVVGST